MSNVKIIMSDVKIILIILSIVALCQGGIFLVSVYVCNREHQKIYEPIKSDTYKEIEEYVTNYFNKKYGNNEFRVLSVEKEFNYCGFISYFCDNYYVCVEGKFLDYKIGKKITIHFEKNGIKYITEGDYSEHNFLAELYKQELWQSIDLKLYGGLSIELYMYPEKIPNNLGHIPSLEELIELKAINRIDIRRNFEYDLSDIEERINFLKKVSKCVFDKSDVSKYIELQCNIRDRKKEDEPYNSNELSYEISIVNNKIKIYNKEHTYEFDIDEILNMSDFSEKEKELLKCKRVFPTKITKMFNL